MGDVRLPADPGGNQVPDPTALDVDDATWSDDALRQTIPPPQDGRHHADLGVVSGGMGEEGTARHHHDG